MTIIRTSALVLALCATIAACSDDNTSSNPSDGGTGGESGSGGAKSTGGSKATTGGATSTGGSAGKGTGGSAGKGTGGPDASTDGGDGGALGPPTLGTVIDRMGRPAINTALNATFETDATKKGKAKDAYNAAPQDKWGTFVPEFEKNLAILDALDGTCGNQVLAGKEDAGAGRYATLATVLSDDQLYVNTTVSECGVYLGVEAEVIKAVPAGGGKCGGRTLKDDVIDRSYSLLAAGLLTGVDDTITADEGAQTATFPFLGPPTLPPDAGDGG